MKPETIKNIKEWLEIIALSALGGIVVFHINGFLGPKEDKANTTSPVKTEVVKPVTQKDTIAQQIITDAKQLKR